MSRAFFSESELSLQRKLEIARAIQQLNQAAKAMKDCPIHVGNIDQMVRKIQADVENSEKLLNSVKKIERLMSLASVDTMAKLVRDVPHALEHDNVAEATKLHESDKAHLIMLKKLNTPAFKHLLSMKDLMANCLSFMARFLQALYNVFSDLNANQLVGMMLFVLPRNIHNTNTLTVDQLMHWIDYANRSTPEVEASLKRIEQQFNFQDSQLVNTCMPLRAEFINTHLNKMIERSVELFACFVDKKQLPKGVKGCTFHNINSWKDAINMQEYEAFLQDVNVGDGTNNVTIDAFIETAEQVRDPMPALEPVPRPAPSM